MLDSFHSGIRMMIVDDSPVIRSILREMLHGYRGIEVVGEAEDPYDAREKIKQLNPDVITLDIEMPNMDGISFLEKIMTLRPMPVVMLSTLTQKGADATIRALELGAVDAVGKPSSPAELTALKDDLADRIIAASRARVRPLSRETRAAHQPLAMPHPARVKLVAIGSSTGGVEALRDIIPLLPIDTPPVVMTQHMPEKFTTSFAQRLNALSAITVVEAAHLMPLQKGHAYLAPGNFHLRVGMQGGKLVCLVEDGEKTSGHKPSVDVLFQSVAETVKGNVVAVILTGMGRDGAQGMQQLHELGAYTIGQDEASCIVYGMPKAARLAGAVTIERPLRSIAQEILNHC